MNDLLDEPDRLHSAHVPIRRGNYRRLDWWEPTPARRVRVLAWTCDCQPPKSTAGKRTIVIPKLIIKDLRAHLRDFAQDGEDGLLFAGPNDGPL